MKREHHINFWYVVAAFLAMIAFQSYLGENLNRKIIPYSEFLALAHSGKVADLTIGTDTISGRLLTPAEKPGGTDKQPQYFDSYRVDPALAGQLAADHLTFSGATPPGLLLKVISWFGPLLIFVLVWMFLIRPMATGGGGVGGLMSIGRSRAKIYVEHDVKVTFADVAGVDEAKDELRELVAFLKDPQAYGRLGAHIPKGVLLVGPPGTGKTLLARAVAGEAGVTFFSISGSEFVEMFVGVGAARVRDLFEQARAQAPAIVFIDELDALGRARGANIGGGGGMDEKEQTLNQLLTELDGFDPSVGVVLLAATNRPEILDPALLRAGRFDRQVLVDRPDKLGRIQILNVHLKHITYPPDLDVAAVAAMTPGFTGADLANLVNEAALLATRRHADTVAMEDFTQAIERIIAGLEKRNRLLNPHEREVVAHHEMGHTLVALSLPDADPVQKISIIPRGVAALGYTLQRPIEDRFLMSRIELEHRMMVLLGGRAAESLVFNMISTGAADDLSKATDIARSMVVRFGMDQGLGQVTYEPETSSFLQPLPGWQPHRYGAQAADAIDRAVRDLIERAYQAARAVLQQNQPLLLQAAAQLLQQETMGPDDIAILRTRLQPVAPPALPAPTETPPGVAG